MNNIKKKQQKLHNITGCSSSEKLSLNMYLTFQYISIYLIYLIRGFRCVQEYLNYNNDIKEELIHTQAPWKPWLVAVSCIFPRESNKLKILMLDHCVQICDFTYPDFLRTLTILLSQVLDHTTAQGFPFGSL